MLTNEEIQQLKTQGFVRPQAEVDINRLARLEEIFLVEKSQLENYSGWAFFGIFRKSEDYLSFVRETAVLRMAEQLVGKEVDLYWDSVVTKPPREGKAFLWHQDSGYGETDPLEYFTFWIPFHRTTIDNGCLWVLPGSHQDGLVSHVPAASTPLNYPGKQVDGVDSTGEVPLEMEPGQMLIFSSLLVHRSGLNTSSQKRSALAFAVHKRGYREFNLSPHLKPIPGLALN